jgi:hypothetical protein
MIDHKRNLTAHDAVAHCNMALPSIGWDLPTIGLFCQCSLVDAAYDDNSGQWVVGLGSLDSLLRYLASVNGLGRTQGRD